MADCAVEVLGLTRFHDKALLDKSEVVFLLHIFYARCEWSFGPTRGAMVSGHGEHMLSLLDKPGQMFGGPAPNVIRRPTEEQIARCFARMQNWLALCRAMIRSEFVNFEVIQTFSLFSPEYTHIQVTLLSSPVSFRSRSWT